MAFLCTSLLKLNCSVLDVLLLLNRDTGGGTAIKTDPHTTHETNRPTDRVIANSSLHHLIYNCVALLPTAEFRAKSHLLSHPPPKAEHTLAKHTTFTLNNSLKCEWVCTLISAVFSTHVRFTWRPVKQISNKMGLRLDFFLSGIDGLFSVRMYGGARGDYLLDLDSCHWTWMAWREGDDK